VISLRPLPAARRGLKRASSPTCAAARRNCFGRLALGTGKYRQARLAQASIRLQRARDFHAVGEHFWAFGKQGLHLFRGAQELLRAVAAHARPIGEQSALADAHRASWASKLTGSRKRDVVVATAGTPCRAASDSRRRNMYVPSPAWSDPLDLEVVAILKERQPGRERLLGLAASGLYQQPADIPALGAGQPQSGPKSSRASARHGR